MGRKSEIVLVVVFVAFPCVMAEGQRTTQQKSEAVRIRDVLGQIIGDSNTPEEPNAGSGSEATIEVVGDRPAPVEPNAVSAKAQKPNPAPTEDLPGKITNGDPEALYRSAMTYLESLGDIATDVPRVLELLRKSAELGNSDAMLELAYIYQRGYAVNRDKSMALEWLRKAAEAGKGVAMLALAAAFSEGQDPAVNEQQRMQWIEKGLKSLEEAAEKGDCHAMRILGTVYQPLKVVHSGYVAESVTWFSMQLVGMQFPGLIKDEDKATEWYRKAVAGYKKRATAGDSEAMYWLGKMYEWGWGVEKGVTEELHWYQKAAEAGHRGGRVELGWACHKTEDFENAFKWFQKAANQGESEAMMSLGWLYYKGQGISRDQGEAVKLWRKAADRGHTIAMLSLGAAYANGEGVNQDYQQTITWYRRGADAEDATCMFSLGLMYMTGRGIAADPAKAVDWWRKGAQKEHDGCMANLGWAYSHGKGVRRDRTQAAHWLQQAANLGNEYAKKRLVELGEIR